MITRIWATYYRCLRVVQQQLKAIEILVGPNGSGKSAFLDIVAFLSSVAIAGLDAAVAERSSNFHDLVWGREESTFRLGLEAKIPREHRPRHESGKAVTIRYEVVIRLDPHTETVVFETEEVTASGGGREWQVLHRGPTSGSFSSENYDPEASSRIAQPRGINANDSVLVGVATRSDYPASSWLLGVLRENVTRVRLDPHRLRLPAPPQKPKGLEFDGSQLARLVALLRDGDRKRFKAWIEHVRTAIPELDTVRSVLRPEDRHRYLMLRYANGVEVPSWMASEGTLRLLALTILAYAPSEGKLYLIEEPENGVHPTALETIYQSLSSVYEGQVLLASHSPILINLASPEELLCFTQTAEGTTVARGSDHPALRDWRKDVSLSDLFAAGVLG